MVHKKLEDVVGYILKQAYSPTLLHLDHLCNNRLVTDDSGTILQTNHYDPYGQLLGDISSSTAVSQYKYGNKEWDTATASYDFGARRYTPSIPRWTAIDPLAEKYYAISPYVYCAGNPVNLVDLEGKSTHVKRNPDGQYEVIGGNLGDNDLNIYVGSYDDNGVFIPEYSIGKTTSITSFYNTDSKDKKGEWVIGAIIDLNNMQGQEFLNYIADANLSVIGYAINALPKGILDFKATGGESFGVKYTNDIGFYRGMPVGIDKGGRVIISSARDIGNIVAGYIAGSHGIPWKAARIAFDGLQFLTNGDIKEGASSQNAQHLGWSMGYNHYKSLLSNSSNSIVRLL